MDLEDLHALLKDSLRVVLIVTSDASASSPAMARCRAGVLVPPEAAREPLKSDSQLDFL